VDEMGDLSDFQTGQTMGTRLARVSVTLTAQLFGILRTTAFTIMTVNTKHGKTSSARRTANEKPIPSINMSRVTGRCFYRQTFRLF
uniref:Uncharacterized protein n=1 Tax=Sinocyclocheilus grahami TaxID=75366 RepID=A0A672P1Z3_SINGR